MWRSSSIQVIAHRGAAQDCPENTMAAFDEALRQGCDGIELDLQLTADGVPVVYHNRTLAKAGGGRRRVWHLPVAEVARLDPGARFDKRFRGQHIPLLETILDTYAHRTTLLLEIKIRDTLQRHLALLQQTLRLLRRHRATRKVMILCFDHRVLEACAQQAPVVKRVLNIKAPPLMTRTLRRRLTQISALSVDVRTVTSRFAAAVRRAGCPMLFFPCNTPRRVALAVRVGAMGIMSRRPGWLRDTLEQR